MKTLIISNFKGGSGKTTTAVNLAAIIAAGSCGTDPRRVLLLDLDAQGNLSTYMQAPRGHKGVYEYIQSNGSGKIDQYIIHYGDSIGLIRSAYNLAHMSYSKDLKRLLEAMLKAAGSMYDLCIVDTPPALNGLTLAAVNAADYAIIPCMPDAFNLDGLQQILTVPEIREKVIGVIIVNRRSTSSAERFAEAIESTAEAADIITWPHHIRQCAAIVDAQEAHAAVIDLAPGSNAAQDYKALAADIMRRIK